MIDFSAVVKWLNIFDESELDDSAELLLTKRRQSTGNEDERSQDDAVLEATARVSRNPFCTAEVLIILSEDLFLRGQYKVAWIKLSEAVKIYADQSKKVRTQKAIHRLAVARWLCGWSAWKLHAHYTACDAWMSARAGMVQLLENSEDEKQEQKEKWYQQAIFEMEVELGCTAEEAYTWLNKYPAQNIIVRAASGKKKVGAPLIQNDEQQSEHLQGLSMMGKDLFILRNKVVEEIKRAEEGIFLGNQDSMGDFHMASQVIHMMLKMLEQRFDLNERAEALVECGLAFHQIGEHREASIWLSRAVSYFKPGSHQQAVARWMCGLLQLQLDSGDLNAFNNLQIANDNLVDLRCRAEIANNEELVKWYTHIIQIMDAAVDKLRYQQRIS